MSNAKRIFNTLLLAFLGTIIMAQSTVSGTVMDDSGTTLINAYIYVQGTEVAGVTDFDGKYKLEVPFGTYNLKITYIGYADKIIENVSILENQVTYLDVSMSEGTEELKEVVVKAKMITRSENSVLLLQKKSYKIQDGISSQEMSKLAVGNVASAMKKITGATVQDGKYLNIRGLGDRYSLAQLDGIQLPSVDPYRNSAQLDFIPTNIIENIIASKTFTPDQPGTFTGGNVSIVTKSFPEQETFSFGLSTSYNTESNLNDRFLKNSRSSTDFLGYDDGSRSLPSEFRDPNNADYMQSIMPLLSRLGKTELAEGSDRLSKMLDFEFESQRSTAPLNHGVSFSYGNSFQLKNGHEVGLILASKYNRNFIHKEDQVRAQYGLNGEIRNFGRYTSDQSVESPFINGFAGLSYKFNANHSITFKNLYNHQAEISSRQVIGEDGQNIEAPSFKIGRDNTFQELEMNMSSLSGSHKFEKLAGLKVDWIGSVINSSRYEPELAYLSSQFNSETGIEGIPEANVAPPLLFWREIMDMSYYGKVDFTLPLAKVWNSELKFGALYNTKTRNSDETSLNIATGIDAAQFDGKNIGDFFAKENAGIIGTYDNGRNIIGNYVVDYTNPKNSYTGYSKVSAGYLMTVLRPTESFKLVTGVRAEYTDIFAQSKIVQTIESVSADSTNTGQISELDFLPALSMIFSATDDINFRLNFSKTIARPSLREIAPFASWDPILSIFFLGNPDLHTTDIFNYDARWEYFINPGELIALSVFYKDFKNPISQTVKPAANTEFQFVNVESGYVSGFEIELRKSLGFLNPKLNNFKFGANLALVRSQMAVPSDARFIPETRTFEGQSPILANSNISYSNPEMGLSGAIAYNYLGKRLSSLGDQGPDTYLDPFHSLDFNFSKTFGKYAITFGINNILNNSVRETIEYQGQEFTTNAYEKGRTFSFGASYKY